MNRVVFGYKELVSVPETVQLCTHVISVWLLAEQITVEAEDKKVKEKIFNTLQQSRSWEANSSSASQIYEILTFTTAFAWARRLFLSCFG